MNADASESKNIIAPTRSSGTCARGIDLPSADFCMYPLSDDASCVSESVKPGVMAFALMPSGPSSREMALASPMTLALTVV